MPGFDAAALAVRMPDTATLAAVVPLILLELGLLGYALSRLVRTPVAPYLPKWVWALLIVGVNPWGAIVFLVLVGTARRGADREGAPTPQAPTPQAPHPRAGVVPQEVTVPSAVAAGGPVVRTRGLTRDYGGTGLFGVDIAVPAGSVYGLVGPNGAGKTTLLSIVTGMRRADRGEVEVAVPRTSVAVCPDVPEFEPWLTAYEVVDLARSTVARHLGPDAVLRALATAGLADQADRRVGGFSRGMFQRLGLAAAVVGDPALLILDEPTSALDPVGRAEVLDLVAAMRGRRTVIFSSHILADVQRVADHVGIMRAGRLVHQGPTRALIDDHLKPRWTIRLAEPVDDLVAALRGQPWVRHVAPVDGDRLLVEADTMEHGARGIPRMLAAEGSRLVACEPLAADLESAFLALTAGPTTTGATTGGVSSETEVSA